MREELLHYYERELTFLRRMGAEFAQRYPKVAGRLMLEPNKCEDPHVERMLEAFAFLAARVHLKHRRRLSRDQRVAAQHRLSALRAADSGDVDRRSSARSGAGQADDGLQAAARHDALLASRRRRAVQVPDLLRRHALADQRRGRAVDHARPASPAGATRRRRRPCCASSCAASPTSRSRKLGSKTLRFYLDGAGNLTSALYELLNTSGREIVVREVAARRRAAASPKMITLPASALQPGGPRARRGHAAVSRALVRGVPAHPGVLRLSREVSLSRPRRVRSDRGRRDGRRDRDAHSGAGVRAHRVAADARERRHAVDAPAGLHADRQPVPARRRSRSCSRSGSRTIRSSPTRAAGSRRRSSPSTTSSRSRPTRSGRCAFGRSTRRRARRDRARAPIASESGQDDGAELFWLVQAPPTADGAATTAPTCCCRSSIGRAATRIPIRTR